MRTLVLGILCGVVGMTLILSSFERNALPEEDASARLTGIASHYGMDDGFHGKCMADGHFFDKNLMTAAHKSLPLGTKVRVKYQGRSVFLTITDRGPFIPGRVIDLSEAAARTLGLIEKGIDQVTIEVLEEPQLSQKYHHENPKCLKDAPDESHGKTMVARSR